MNKTTPTVPLEQLCDSERGITYGIVKVGDFVPGGVPVIRGGDIRNNQIVFDDQKRVTEEVSNRFRRTILKGGEVLINLIAEPGHVAIVPNDLAGSNVSRDVAVIPLNDSVDHRFVCYFLKSPQCVQWLTSRLQGSVTQKINLNTLREVPVPVPPLPEQKAIAHILGTLDDKIELNQQMNRTLEAIARAIFKSWFVDFDPVRAKMDGRQPAGMDAATADLFPDSFEDSPLGKIPKGWKVGVFDDLIHILSGGTPKTSIPEYWNGDILWFSVKDTPHKSDVFVIDTEKRITRLGIEKSATQILPQGTTIITARGTVGKLALLGVEMAMNQSCFGIRGKNSYPDFFIYYHLYSVISELQRQTHGSVFDTINRQTFTTVKAVLPALEISQIFDCEVKPIMDKILINLFEVRTLTTIRDILLPNLLSGLIRVKEAEKLLEVVE